MTVYKPGTIVDGRYCLVAPIGSGATGLVYSAEDRELSAPVAIKFLHPAVGEDPVVLARMAREARAMGVLSGTSATQILAFNTSQEGVRYIVMELLDGKDLGAYLVGLESQGKHLGVERFLELFEPVVDTLEAAHERGIIHRDVKPANIFVLRRRARGVVRLLDFGLAKELGAVGVTRQGAITGTPIYMSPEGWSGRPQDLDARADVYSLGAVMFRALAGRPPFQAKGIGLMREVLGAARPSLRVLRPELPEAVDGWVAQALAVTPKDRFQTARALWIALIEALGRELPVDED
ncbi:serine/threonine-protein kinase [Polyangium aurulentum]|uniref:serine/threonine-protein kinase n=1 Tax=Polyangium aurulentum TaxID=2567896 RepID=UPI0010AE4CC1|nr:serine/threonine-protein kinase [Polyangium aurulentum]UQA61016.1 serine/threonine protein kinase [Polyangium aurulentum]